MLFNSKDFGFIFCRRFHIFLRTVFIFKSRKEKRGSRTPGSSSLTMTMTTTKPKPTTDDTDRTRQGFFSDLCRLIHHFVSLASLAYSHFLSLLSLSLAFSHFLSHSLALRKGSDFCFVSSETKHFCNWQPHC